MAPIAAPIARYVACTGMRRGGGRGDAPRASTLEEDEMDLNASYGHSRRLEGVGVERARERIVAALKEEGFGVLTEIDVRATMKQKLGVEMPPYVILGACNPNLAHKALLAEPAVGLLLPCNVVVAEDGRDAVIAAASPRAMFSVVGDSAPLEPVATEAEARIKRAIDKA
ncbi:MAG TPA: DUF302 domain-containing protein [Minicystis sp.]|nr:DUF302 domain-containing protein [Minicystis sp.]